MSIVSDTVKAYLPAKKKMTPSGWLSFNAPCCVHNGTGADTRMRGGVIEEGDTFSYHCFNCNFKASWQPGRNISYKLKQLMIWLNIPDDTINKLALEVLKLNEGIEVQAKILELPEFKIVDLPPDSVKITDELSNSRVDEIKNYLNSRNLRLDMGYDFYWSSAPGYRDRFIVPFYQEGKIVGYTARSVVPGKKPKYLTNSQPGYVFNLDEQRPQKVFCIVTEGTLDAILLDGVAVLRADLNEQQALQINQLNKDVIVLPDRDKEGKALVELALDYGWSVSMPEWEPGIKDASDAVLKYGRIYTLYSVVAAAESSPLKIKLKAKKWYAQSST
jgi:hypothetical protein